MVKMCKAKKALALALTAATAAVLTGCSTGGYTPEHREVADVKAELVALQDRLWELVPDDAITEPKPSPTNGPAAKKHNLRTCTVINGEVSYLYYTIHTATVAEGVDPDKLARQIIEDFHEQESGWTIYHRTADESGRPPILRNDHAAEIIIEGSTISGRGDIIIIDTYSECFYPEDDFNVHKKY